MRLQISFLTPLVAGLLLVTPSASAPAAPLRSLPVSGAIVAYLDDAPPPPDFNLPPTKEKIVGVPPWAVPYGRYTYVARGLGAHAVWQGSQYLQGTEWSEVSLNMRVFCGTSSCDVSGGSLQGTDRFMLDSIAGGWDGKIQGHVTGFEVDVGLTYEGTILGAGWGELKGWSLRATFTKDAPSAFIEVTGYVVPPTGA